MAEKYEFADKFNYGLLKDFALKHRKDQTEAESILWEYLKGNSLGVRFRRQYVIDNFIGDFVCLSCKLVIEIDGGYHNAPDQIIADRERSERLNHCGFYVIRFTNEQVLFDTDYVLERIKEHINQTKYVKRKNRLIK